MNERGDEMVALTTAPDYDSYEAVRRSDLPDDAYEGAAILDGANVDGGEPGTSYVVWVVNR